MLTKQHTLADSFTLSGSGLHTGQSATLWVHPAGEDAGIVFVRTDLEGQPQIPASIERVDKTERSTNLKKGAASVATVEHLLSALCGMHIDNARIEIDGPEVPILDGSASPFVEAIQRVGRTEQAAERKYFRVKKAIRYHDPATGAEISVLPADSFQVTSTIDFGETPIGLQRHSYTTGEDYAGEIARARTFCFLHEIEFLYDRGLIRGGDLENAVVYVREEIPASEVTRIAQKIGKPALEVRASGTLTNTQLRYANEAGRHKLLDLIGDLYLLGRPILGRITAYKPGHGANAAFTKLLHQQLAMNEQPTYDPTVEALMDVNKIMEWLPHRHPFLLVDKIVEMTDNYVVGVKNVTMNEWFFPGHFPGNPVFPGVLQVEAMAQTGGILALSLQDDPHGWDTYFVRIDKTRFRHMVKPGDTLLLKLELEAPIRRGMVQMRGTAYVGDKLVSEGHFVARIVQRTTDEEKE